MALFTASIARADEFSDDHKTTVAKEVLARDLTTNPNFTVTIEKGLAKRMLIVTGSLHAQPTANAVIYMVGGVNSSPLHANIAPKQTCAASTYCTLSYTWWVDVDAAELAHPGDFVGQPLTAQITIGSSGAANGWFSMTMQMVKK